MTRHGKCAQCDGLLIEIDHYGERLIGCINCNRWSWPRSDRMFMQLAGRGPSGTARGGEIGKRVQFDEWDCLELGTRNQSALQVGIEATAREKKGDRDLEERSALVT
jgi:hypothetical protein